jgi:hypothetical protein
MAGARYTRSSLVAENNRLVDSILRRLHRIAEASGYPQGEDQEPAKSRVAPQQKKTPAPSGPKGTGGPYDREPAKSANPTDKDFLGQVKRSIFAAQESDKTIGPGLSITDKDKRDAVIVRLGKPGETARVDADGNPVDDPSKPGRKEQIGVYVKEPDGDVTPITVKGLEKGKYHPT